MNLITFDNSYARLSSEFYQKVAPLAVPAPRLILFNSALAGELGIDENSLTPEQWAKHLSGNELFEGSDPLAQAYAGHQFGHFNMLGDGRAHLLGEILTPSGKRFDLQLKGSGPTKFSRRGDGRAALGPMLREFLISEAMHALGIPTTRSLAVVETGEVISRETPLDGAILTRVAGSHIRVGSFEFAAATGGPERVKELADYTIQRHFPKIVGDGDIYLSFLKQVCERQAKLISQWMSVGFIHGVMNTDNMAISGESIDYGPCAFMNQYDPATVFSSIDRQGRYAYGNQPLIAQWNLARFAETLIPLLDSDQKQAIKKAEEIILNFQNTYETERLSSISKKLGFESLEDQDKKIINELFEIMQAEKLDFTTTFRSLSEVEVKTPIKVNERFQQWQENWRRRVLRNSMSEAKTLEGTARINPAIIPRNHLVEEALGLAVNEGQFDFFNELLQALRNPFRVPDEGSKLLAPVPQGHEESYQTFCGT